MLLIKIVRFMLKNVISLYPEPVRQELSKILLKRLYGIESHEEAKISKELRRISKKSID